MSFFETYNSMHLILIGLLVVNALSLFGLVSGLSRLNQRVEDFQESVCYRLDSKK